MIEEYKNLSVREQLLLLMAVGVILFVILKIDILKNANINSLIKLIGGGTLILMFTLPLVKIIVKFRICIVRFSGKYNFINYLTLFRYWVIRLHNDRKIKIRIFKLQEEKGITLGRYLHKWFRNCEIEYYVNIERTNAKFTKLANVNNEYDYKKGNNKVVAFLNTFVDDNLRLLESRGSCHKFISKKNMYLNIEKLNELNKIVSEYEEITFFCSGRVYLYVQLGKYIQMLEDNKRTKKVTVLIYDKSTGDYKEKNEFG